MLQFLVKHRMRQPMFEEKISEATNSSGIEGRAANQSAVIARPDKRKPTMSNGKVQRNVTVTNSQGLHARPASLIVKLTTQYQSRIEFIKENSRIDGKSILEILTLGAPCGTKLIIEADGSDADTAVEALANLFATKFGEDDNEQT
jgi:phosphocarrier protein HPr